MALTLLDFRLHVTQAMGTPDTGLPPSGGSATTRGDLIVNMAGRYLFKRLWNFRIAPPAIVGFTAPITIANGTWTTSSKTLTKASAFTNYTFAAGDIIEITDGTGATDGLYHIAGKTSSNAITLATDCGATTGSTDIDAQIDFPYVNLPSDFGDLIGIEMNSTSACIYLADLNEVMARRLRNVALNSSVYQAAIVQPGQTAISSALPVARLELDHAPTAVDPDVFFVSYRRKWTTLSADTDYAQLPEYAEDLLIEYIRAFIEGYMNAHADEDGILPVVSMADRLKDIDDGPMFHLTKETDGLIQSDYGSIGQGPAGRPWYGSTWRSRTSGAVADPA